MTTPTSDERESDTLALVHASSTEGEEDARIEPVPDAEREPDVAPVPDTDKKIESVSLKVPCQSDEQEASRHLWVGNVSSNVTEAAVIERFSKFGEVENAMVYPMRNYAFVNFKKLEDAVYAKKGLQGANLEGLAIRIEFAKGVKTCRYLWVGNICGTVTRDELEAEFKKFGVVEDLRLVRDRNCAFVDYTKVDDAIAAYESLNRKKLGKKEICIEYVRSQLQSRKDNKVEDRHEADALGDEQSKMTSSNGGRTNSEKFKRDKDGNASEVLWIGFPIYMKVDERKLRRTFSPFGVIERVTTFPGRTYAFVQFQNVKSASRAKDALQGKLFNDPRVSISFAKSEVGPADHNRAINSPADHSRAINNFTSSISRSDLPPLLPLQKAGAPVNPRNDRYLGLSTSRSGGPNFRRSGDESDAYHRYEREPNLNMKNGMGRIMRAGPEHGMKPDIGVWRSRPLPESGIPHFRRSPPYGEGRWNDQEELGKREQKRQRTEGDHHQGGAGVVELSSFEVGNDREQLQVVRAQDYLSKVTKTNGSDSRVPENWQEYEGVPQGRPPSSNADFPVPVKDDWSHPAVPMRPPDGGFQWQGVLAKSGTSVCHAKCYAVSNHIDAIFPEVINCTARTSLDMLAQHISQVGNFAVVSFIPLGDFDVAPYQEFILYLSEKNRAAVCKLSVESTLFLVPPSRFAEQILKVPNNNTIFGVVLKLQHTDPSSQFFTEQMGVSQPIQAQRLLPPNGLAELMPNAPLGQSLPDTAPSHAPYIMPSAAEMILSQTSQPQQLGFQSSNSSIPVFTPGIMVSSAAQLNTAPGHLSIVDGNRASQHAPGFPPPSHDHQSTSLISASYNIVPTQSHQEQGLQTPFQVMVPPNQVTSGLEHFPVLQGPINQNMPVSVPFQQAPRPPQYPPPIMQTSHSDHVQLVSPHQPQPSSNIVQLPQTNLPPQLPPSGQLQVQHQTAPLNLGQIADSWSVGIHQPPPAVTKVEGGQLPQQIAGQPEIQASQQNLPGKGGGDDTKRFQATLQLAAALLQQLQQRTQS